jgi:hypothetical protein
MVSALPRMALTEFSFNRSSLPTLQPRRTVAALAKTGSQPLKKAIDGLMATERNLAGEFAR